MEKLLEVKNLKVSFFTDLGETQAVKDAGFAIEKGDFFGIVGESGSGKSVTTKSILRLGTSNCKVLGGEILFKGEDILKKNAAELREIRGGEIAMIFQDSLSALNPVYTVGSKMVELIRRHTKMSKAEAKKRAVELLAAVGITDPEKSMKSYPHELSGGMRQRVMIAMALACNPKVIIADEPTTALDVTIQAQILDLLRNLKDRINSSIMLITHDLGVIAEMADYVVVMYAGRVVEKGTAQEIFANPAHPYTIGLMASKPIVGKKVDRLYSIPGKVPNPVNMPNYCYFKDRCEMALPCCDGEYPCEISLSPTHKVSCYRYYENNRKAGE